MFHGEACKACVSGVWGSGGFGGLGSWGDVGPGAGRGFRSGPGFTSAPKTRSCPAARAVSSVAKASGPKNRFGAAAVGLEASRDSVAGMLVLLVVGAAADGPPRNDVSYRRRSA